VLAHRFRDESLCDDMDLEISVLHALGHEIQRGFVHRQNSGLKTQPANQNRGGG
jgi:hypothetical protein